MMSPRVTLWSVLMAETASKTQGYHLGPNVYALLNMTETNANIVSLEYKFSISLDLDMVIDLFKQNKDVGSNICISINSKYLWQPR